MDRRRKLGGNKPRGDLRAQKKRGVGKAGGGASEE